MTKLLRFALSGMAILLLGPNALAQCVLNQTSDSVTICTPVNGATVSSPVSVVAGTTDNAHPVVAMKAYLDNVNVYSVSASRLNTTLSMTNGSHKLTVNAWDSSGAVFKSSVAITVASNAAVSVMISPRSATLAPGQAQQFTSTVLNTLNAAVTWSVDGFFNGNTTVGMVSTTGKYTAGTALGTHNVVATSVADTTKSASATVVVSSTPLLSFPASSHVFIVIEENHGFSQVFPAGEATQCASSSMPYLCGLAATNGMALQFYSNIHGSLRDYLYTTSASAWTGSPYNCSGAACKGEITGDNMVRALTAAGKSWRGYFEGMPTQGYMKGDTGEYVLHHNPFYWYSDVANSTAQQKNMFPFAQFAADLNANDFKNFNYIVPNIVHDADGNGTQSSSALLSSADTWLDTNIAPLLSSPLFQPGGDGILMIVFDEAQIAGESGSSITDGSCSSTQSSGCGGHVAFVMVGPKVLAGSTSSNTYHFQDMVHTIIHLLGMSDYMNTANGEADIDLFPR